MAPNRTACAFVDLDTQGDFTEWSVAQEAPPRTFPVTKLGFPRTPTAMTGTRCCSPPPAHRTDGRCPCSPCSARPPAPVSPTSAAAPDARTLPDLDVSWRLRVDIATRSLECIAHVQPDGWDEEPHLWDARETVPLPEPFWDVLDSAQHVLVTGPVTEAHDESDVQRAADAGELLAVIARVSFG